jgi:hypothetical protein
LWMIHLSKSDHPIGGMTIGHSNRIILLLFCPTNQPISLPSHNPFTFVVLNPPRPEFPYRRNSNLDRFPVRDELEGGTPVDRGQAMRLDSGDVRIWKKDTRGGREQ